MRWVEGPRKPHERHSQGTWSPTTPFNHVRCRGVGAKAGSVHLAYRKLDWARTHLQQHHPVAQGRPFPKKFWLTTGSPQTMPLLQPSTDHDFHDIPPHPWHSSLPVWVEQTAPAPNGSLTDWTGLGDSCQANGGGGQRSNPVGTLPPPLKALLQKAMPNLRHQSHRDYTRVTRQLLKCLVCLSLA